jgi:hypothetical protein
MHLVSFKVNHCITSAHNRNAIHFVFFNAKEANDSYKDIEEHFSLLDTSEEDEIEIHNNNHDSVDGISKPLDALEYEIRDNQRLFLLSEE